jgi:hypothetical protein
VRHQGLKRLLAFGACATVAALLVMRILPELADGVAEEIKTDKTQAQIELTIVTAAPEAIPDTPSEAPSEALTSRVASLVLPPPPAIAQESPETPQPQLPPQAPVVEATPAPEKEAAPPPEPEVSPLPPEPEVALQSTEPEPESKHESQPKKTAQADASPVPELVTAPTPPEPDSEVADLLLEKLQKLQPETQQPVQPEPVVEKMNQDQSAKLFEEQERADRLASSPGREDRAASFEEPAEVTKAEASLSVPLPTSKPKIKEALPQSLSALSAPSDGTRALSIPRENKARQSAEIVAPSPSVEAEGRVLLRILEHGSGPEIEIAWPVSAIQRRALYRLFEACYGMEIAMIDSAGRLFGRSGKSGQAWQPNMDRYSGFVRQPAGRLTRDEKARLAHIRALHGGLRNANHVRLFPRRLDALLLGGLKALVGEGYSRANAIRAHYRRDGDIVLVESIRLDGQPILGRIDLSAASRRCRSGAWS